ncbi:MAG: cysteine desulfurase family protein [Chlamydiales bacterium]
MIYLDNNATTALDRRVLEAMHAVSINKYLGNISSPHSYGQKARHLFLQAKKEILTFLNALDHDILFTSGATEGLNTIIQSVPDKAHIVTSSLEHAAVLESCKSKSRVTYLDPKSGRGSIAPEQIEQALLPDTALIVCMAANNETGVLSDIVAIAQLAEQRGIPFLVDGVSILGKGSISIPQGVSAICFSAHKIHGPQGMGCIVYKKGMKIRPLICGGAQQRGLRAGTENLSAIVGFAKALELASRDLEETVARMELLRNRLELSLGNVVVHGKDEPRVCNTSNIAFRGRDGETLLMQLDLAGVAVSYGAACASQSLQLSHVLQNMHVAPDLIRSSLRFSLSRETTLEEIDYVSRLLTVTDFTPNKFVSSATSSY